MFEKKSPEVFICQTFKSPSCFHHTFFTNPVIKKTLFKLDAVFMTLIIDKTWTLFQKIVINERYRIARKTTVSASPTVGGFAGYFKNGIK